VSVSQRLLLQGVMDVGPIIVIPDRGCLWIGARGTVIKEDHIGLDTLRIKDTGGQSEDRVQVGGR